MSETDENGDVQKTNENDLIQKFSDYQSLHLHQKFKFRLSNQGELELFGKYSRTGDIPRYDRLIEEKDDTAKYAEWYYGPQEWTLIGLRHTSNKHRRLFDASNVSVHYQQWKESRNDRRFQDSLLNQRNESVDIYGIDLDLSKRLSNNQSLSYGLSSYYNIVSSEAKSENIFNSKKENLSTRYPSGGSVMWLNGVYSEFQKELEK